VFLTQDEPDRGGEPACCGLIISMKNGEQRVWNRLVSSWQPARSSDFEANNREEIYCWITRTLVEQEYGGQKREAKGLSRKYRRPPHFGPRLHAAGWSGR
jgi:hypothetical protein